MNTRASLCASGWETWYARAGSGAPVVLLADLTNPAEARLFSALAKSHRVFAPERPVPVSARDRDAAERASTGVLSETQTAMAFDPLSWLRDFVDGLGLVPVMLVVTDASLAAAALELALADSARPIRLILLPHERDANDDADAVTDFTTLALSNWR